jgi:hypothetical protein
MSMSKRDYENVARVMRTNRQYNLADRTANEIIDNIVGDLAVAFASDNERFDEGRFVTACEYPS